MTNAPDGLYRPGMSYISMHRSPGTHDMVEICEVCREPSGRIITTDDVTHAVLDDRTEPGPFTCASIVQNGTPCLQITPEDRHFLDEMDRAVRSRSEIKLFSLEQIEQLRVQIERDKLPCDRMVMSEETFVALGGDPNFIIREAPAASSDDQKGTT